MTFTFIQKVLFKHCDPAGIVFYPRYFEMLNDCVEAWFDERIAMPFEAMHAVGGGVPTARIEAAFKAPSRHGDMLDIALSCTQVGRSSADLSFAGTCDGMPRFTASSTIVHVDADGRPARWPDAARRRIQDEIGDD